MWEFTTLREPQHDEEKGCVVVENRIFLTKMSLLLVL